MNEVLLAVACGAIVGLSLGLTGGGGSIFAVPLLIYVMGLPPGEAAPVSLAAVAATAAVGAAGSIQRRLVVWQPAILFALGGFLGAPLGARAAKRVDPEVVLAAFALLAVTTAFSMWRSARRHPEDASAVRARSYEAGGGAVCVLAPDGKLRFTAPCAAALAFVGIATGALSRLFGVGAGFLIVPALVLVTRMGVHRAVATSLVIITAIACAGTIGAVSQGLLAWPVLLPFAAGGAGAMLVARLLAERLAGASLQKTFAILIALVGVGMLIDSFVRGFGQ